MKTHRAQQAIALVPGFLGFDQPPGVDRFAAALQMRMEAESGEPVRVFPIPTLPIGSLFERQGALMKVLQLLDRLGGPYDWHLVGHSTGGVDAALLTRRNKLIYSESKGSHFSDEPLALQLDLRSVTTLSAPHYGTCLALSPVATIAHGAGAPRGLAAELWDGICSLGQRDAFLERMQFSFDAGWHASTLRFLAHLLLGNELATDLRPEVAGKLTRTDNRREDIPLFCFASVAPSPATHPSDRLFEVLWNWTRKGARMAMNAPPLDFDGSAIIAGPTRIPTEITPQDNDGVVNTDRQVLPGTFAGLLVGDHGDVIGRYRRRDAVGQRIVDPGLLTTGAQFGDEQFFATIARIGHFIASAMGEHQRGARRTPEVAPEVRFSN